MSYVTERISDDLLSETQKSWESVVGGSDEFTSEYGALFEWLRGHRDYKSANGDSEAYAITQKGENRASAFIEIVSSTNRGGLTKLLKVFISPKFWGVAEHQNTVVQIFIMAIKGAVEISARKSSRTIKIYGRSSALLSLLKEIHSAIIEGHDLQSSNIVATMQGRWLVIELRA